MLQRPLEVRARSTRGAPETETDHPRRPRTEAEGARPRSEVRNTKFCVFKTHQNSSETHRKLIGNSSHHY